MTINKSHYFEVTFLFQEFATFLSNTKNVTCCAFTDKLQKPKSGLTVIHFNVLSSWAIPTLLQVNKRTLLQSTRINTELNDHMFHLWLFILMCTRCHYKRFAHSASHGNLMLLPFISSWITAVNLASSSGLKWFFQSPAIPWNNQSKNKYHHNV